MAGDADGLPDELSSAGRWSAFLSVAEVSFKLATPQPITQDPAALLPQFHPVLTVTGRLAHPRPRALNHRGFPTRDNQKITAGVKLLTCPLVKSVIKI